MKKPKTVHILFCQGVEGKSVYINDTRVAGSKPWGGGKTLAEFTPSLSDVMAAISDRSAPTKDQLGRRVARLAGELTFGVLSAGTFKITDMNAEQAVRQLLTTAREWISYRPRDDSEARRCAKVVDKLEAALAAWEAAR
jgi:hypothetical protein